MSDEFSDGDVVWVKCGTLFWPARVVDYKNLPDEIKEDLPEGKEKPKTIAKFFDEDGYEYLFDNKNIFPYNCSRKEEFIKKGIGKSKSKSKEGATSGWFSKFPNDVILSEKLTGGDEKILEKEPYVEKPTEKINYKELFGQSAAQQDKEKKKAETPKSAAKKRKAENSPAKKTPLAGGKKKKESEKPSTPARPIVHPRFMEGGSGSDHQVKILPQPSAPYHIDLQMKQDKLTSASPNTYTCSICGFAATRINVIVLHNKSHSEPAKNNSFGQRPGSAVTARKPVPSSPATPKEKKKATPTSASSTLKQTPKVNTAKKTANAASETSTATSSSTKATTPKTKAASKTEAASKAPATPVPTTETPRRGRGRPPAATPTAAATPVTTTTTAAAVASKKSPTKAPAPEPANVAVGKTKKPRMTKKKKELMLQEKEKKEEERQKIMGEWSEEEEGEAEERKKINESLGKSDEGSDEDFDRDDFLGDDHVHGYDDDEDEEDEPMETAEVKKDEKESEPTKAEKTTNGQKESGAEEEKQEGKAEEEEIKLSEKENEIVPVSEEPGFDIDKVLAETSVPELSSDIENVVKKSVKFSPHISKEIALKTIRVMQPESNLLDPQDVDDEFAFTEEPRIPELMATKTILKRSRNKSDSPFKQSDAGVTASPPKNTVKLTFNAPAEELTDEDKEQDAAQAAEQAAAAVVNESSVQQEPIPETPILTSGDSELITHQHHEQVVHEEQHHHVQHHSIPTQMLLQTSEGQHIQVHNGAPGEGGEHEGETYILLVDDDDENARAHLESLNSQTLYIDSSSLANGDLSNMVLMTGPPHTTEGEQVSNQVVTFSTGETNQLNTAGNLQLTTSGELTSTAAYSQDQMEH